MSDPASWKIPLPFMPEGRTPDWADQCRIRDERIKELEAERDAFKAMAEKIDIKAQAGLCQMTFGGAREFLKDIRILVLEAPNVKVCGERSESERT